jgi:cobalamin synthase
MSVAGAVMAIFALAAGVPTAGRSPVELVAGGFLTPLWILGGPGLLVALALLGALAFAMRRGMGRRFAVAASAAAGLLWLAIFLSPQLLADPPRLPDPAVFAAVVPWIAFGFAARLGPGVTGDIRRR